MFFGKQRAVRAMAAGALICATATGCRLSNLGNIQLTKDNRLTFTSPKQHELVKTPLTVSWTMTGDYKVTGLDGGKSTDAGVYAVFVDRSPISVGDDLKAVAKGDKSCQRDPRCPDATYLAGQNVYVTTKPTLTLPFLPSVSDGVGDEQHTISVVLLDGTGTRRTESAWFVNFRYPRRKL